MTFTPTPTRTVRKIKATNKGLNLRLARRLRALAEMLEHKNRDEFSRVEISALQKGREDISTRLYANACAKSATLVLDGKVKIVDGQYRVDLDPKDL